MSARGIELGHHGSRASRPGRWSAAVLGTDPQLRLGIRRTLPTLLTFVVCASLLLFGTTAQLGPAWKAYLVSGYLAAVWLLPYGLLRSGCTRRLDDPLLTYPTLLLNISTVMLAYGLLSEARGAPLQLLSVLLAAQMSRLPSRRMMRAALIALVMLAATLALVWRLEPDSFKLADELLNFAMLAVMLPACALVAREVQRTRARRTEQQAELARTLERLRELSTRDPLTGLANRRQMMSWLDEELKRQRRSRHALCVAILDLDHFKRVNDTHGHPVGDAVLQRFATLAQSTLPPTAALARWGGEEFLLMLPDIDVAQAARVLAAIRQSLHAFDWGALAPGLRVTCSAGLAAHVGDASAAHTLERADRALYLAKQAGRDTAFCDEAELPAEADAGPAHGATASAPCLATAPRNGHPLAPPSLPADAAESPRSAPPPAPDRPTPGAGTRLIRLVMGSHPTMRDNLRLSLLGVAVYLAWVLVINGYAVPRGLVWPRYRWPLLAIDLVGALAFYPIIRSGLSARWRDPELSLPQLLWGCIAATAAYVAIPDMRPPALQALCVIQIFGMVTLAPRATVLVSLFSVGLMLAALAGVGLYEDMPTPLWQAEILKVMLACFVLAQLGWLSRRVSRVRQQVARDQASLAAAVEQVRDLAVRDALTGLHNRRHLMERLERERLRAEHLGQPFCVALLDLDHFKRVNDTHGHAVGDDVLRGVAQVLRRCMRESDVLGRWGGEEFIILMPDTQAHESLIALNRLRRQLSQSSLVGSIPLLRTTVSAGVAAHRSRDSVQQLIERADRALYGAKEAGRDRCVVAP
ncbi:diguanylate cyclase [Aquabacterium sp.]|uniref:diguanylate cyclase n=1 Tax=Aquabacterium sp. TaxID=1872578 RepID=UPI0035B4882E